MLRLSIICLFGLLPALLAAAELDGHYLARFDGQPAEMILRSQGSQIEGEYVERSNLRLNISGHWQGVDGLLMMQLQGHSDYQPAAYYRFSEQYLITESNTGKMAWQRRQ